MTKTQVVDFSALDNTTIQTSYSGAAAIIGIIIYFVSRHFYDEEGCNL